MTLMSQLVKDSSRVEEFQILLKYFNDTSISTLFLVSFTLDLNDLNPVIAAISASPGLFL